MNKRVIHLPAIKIKTGLDWCTGAEIVQQFRVGINQAIPAISRGKNL